jgi:hypothetical protein
VPRATRARRATRTNGIARVLRVSRFAAASALFFSILTACSFDWAVRPDPGDAAMADAQADASRLVDGRAETSASDSATTDAPVPTDGNDCSGLATTIATAKLAARACQIAQTGQCTTAVTDECGCMVPVRTAGSAESTDYTNAIAAYLAACGKPACGTCSQLPLQSTWACLTNPSGTECFP